MPAADWEDAEYAAIYALLRRHDCVGFMESSSSSNGPFRLGVAIYEGGEHEPEVAALYASAGELFAEQASHLEIIDFSVQRPTQDEAIIDLTEVVRNWLRATGRGTERLLPQLDCFVDIQCGHDVGDYERWHPDTMAGQDTPKIYTLARFEDGFVSDFPVEDVEISQNPGCVKVRVRVLGGYRDYFWFANGDERAKTNGAWEFDGTGFEGTSGAKTQILHAGPGCLQSRIDKLTSKKS